MVLSQKRIKLLVSKMPEVRMLTCSLLFGRMGNGDEKE